MILIKCLSNEFAENLGEAREKIRIAYELKADSPKPPPGIAKWPAYISASTPTAM